jgi:hypothetical protein
MPRATLDIMTAIGSPGIMRGRKKFNRKAAMNVMKNQNIFFPKYL